MKMDSMKRVFNLTYSFINGYIQDLVQEPEFSELNLHTEHTFSVLVWS